MSESTLPAKPPEPEIDPIISGLADFSDRISPMIVKELRQGLRTRTFTGTFLVLQVILGFSMLGAMMADSSNTGQMISSMVFFLFSIVALILQPLRGTAAVATELKDDTLEILSLTRLSTVRIVFGKWASLVSQTALMLAATVPYLVMRYFFGGMQLFSELALIATVFFLSMCLTAVTVGFSCSRSILLRALVPLLLIPFGLMAISSTVFGFQFGLLQEVFSFQDKDVVITFFVSLVLCGYVGYYFLDMGVGRIAAMAENHSFRKRLISLVLMGVVLVILFLNDPAQKMSLFVVVAFACTIGLDVCTEVPVCVPSVVRPFVKRGKFGRMVGRLFYPGWHSGFLLLLILFVVALAIGEVTYVDSSYRRGYTSLGGHTSPTGLTNELVLFIVGMFYTILAPLLIVRIFIKKMKDAFAGYVMILVLSGLLTLLVSLFTGISSGGGDGFVILTSWIPGVWMIFMDNSDKEIGIFLTSLFLAIVSVLLGVLAAREFSNTARLEKAVADDLAQVKE